MQPAQLSAAVPTVLYQMVHFPASLTVRKFVDPLPQTEEEWVFHGVLCRDPIATFELGRGAGARSIDIFTQSLSFLALVTFVAKM